MEVGLGDVGGRVNNDQNILYKILKELIRMVCFFKKGMLVFREYPVVKLGKLVNIQMLIQVEIR